MRSTQTISEGHPLLLITEVINGVDNLYAAKKLLSSLIQANPEQAIHWLIVGTEQRKDLPERIKQLQIEFASQARIELVMYNKKLHAANYAHVKFILMYPTLNYFTAHNFQQLKSLKLPMLQVYEYDGIYAMQRMSLKYELPCVATGFKGLGLFLDEIDTADSTLSEDVVGDSANELFFSYINAESSGRYQESDFPTFYQVALKIADVGKSVDMITNTDVLPAMHDFAALAWDHGFSHISYLKKDAATGELREEFSAESPRQLGSRHLHLINIFPLPQPQMRALMRKAHPLQQLTGDRSFSEALSLAATGKLIFPFYQITVPKREFVDHWLEYASAHLGNNSHYVKLLKLIASDEKQEAIKFADCWLENPDEILRDADKLHQALLNEKNLQYNFARYLSLLCQFGVNFAPLLLQLSLKLADTTAIGAIIAKLEAITELNEKQLLAQALTEFLMLNIATIDAPICMTILEQLATIPQQKRVRAAVTARKIISALPSTLWRQHICDILPVLNTLSSTIYSQLLENLAKINDLPAFCEQPNWLTMLAERCKSHLIEKASTNNSNILLAVNVMADGLGDLVKYIGAYKTLSKAFPDRKIYSFIRCLDESRPTLLAMLRENSIPVRQCKMYSMSRAAFLSRLLIHGDKYFISECGIAISVATPFDGLKEIIPYHYIEIPEFNYTSYPVVPLDRERSENYEFQVMGIDEESVGIEITDKFVGNVNDLFAQLSPDLAYKLLDSATTTANIASFVKDAFFMPAYLKSEDGVFSIRFALQLMEHHFRDRQKVVLWLHQLPFDVKSPAFLQELTARGYSSFILNNLDGDREVLLADDATDGKQLRIVCGRVNSADFDLMYTLAAHTGGFAGCVGQNSFEKTVSFDVVPVFYAPPWQLEIISQCQALFFKLFPHNSETYKTLFEWFDLLATTSQFFQQRQCLLSSAVFHPHRDRMLAIPPYQYSQQLAQLSTELGGAHDWAERYPYAFGPHPSLMLEIFLQTHQLSVLRAGWETVCAYIRKNKNLNQWLVENVQAYLPSVAPVIAETDSSEQMQLERNDSILGYHATDLTAEQFPALFPLMQQLLKTHWPDHDRHRVRFIITDSQQYVLANVPKLSTPTIAISIKDLEKFSIEEFCFAIQLHRALFYHYPIESTGHQIYQPHVREELIRAVGTDILEHGLSFGRKMLERIAAYMVEEDKKPWYAFSQTIKATNGLLHVVRLQYIAMLKIIELPLAAANKQKIISQTLATSHPFPDEICAEMRDQCARWSTNIATQQTSRIILKRLLTWLPALGIQQRNEQLITPRYEVKEFLLHLEALNIDATDTEIVNDLTQMIDLAYAHKFPQFEALYWLVCTKLKMTDVVPMGVFVRLQSAIVQLVQCTYFQSALSAANTIETFVAAKETKFLFAMGSNKLRDEHDSYAVGEMTISEIGSSINWAAYLTWTDAQLKQLVSWAAEDPSSVLAKALFRLGVTERRELWPRLSIDFIIDFVRGHEIRLARTDVDPDHTEYLKHLYSTFTPIPVSELSIPALENFIDTNKIALAIPRIMPAQAQYLMQLFTEFLVRSESEAKVFLKRFFSDKSYAYGIYALNQTNERLLLWKLPAYDHQDLQRNPYLYLRFMLDMQPGLIPILNILTCISDNIYLEHLTFPVSFFIAHLQLDINSLNATRVGIKRLVKMLNVTANNGAKFISDAIIALPLEAIKAAKSLSLFSNELYEFLTSVDISRDALVVLWQREDIVNELDETEHVELSASQLASLYMLFNNNIAFPTYDLRNRFTAILKEKLSSASVNERLDAIETLIFSSTPIAEMQFAKDLIAEWARLQAAQLGDDDQSSQYYQRITRLMQRISAKAPRIYYNDLLENLLVLVTAQAQVCQYAANIANGASITKKAAKFLPAHEALLAVVNRLINFGLADDTVEYLTSSLINDLSTRKFADRLGRQARSIFDRDLDPPQSFIQSMNFYHQFWGLDLEERAVIINHLLLPGKTLITEQIARDSYKRALDRVNSYFFASDSEDDAIAKALLDSHMEAANPHAKPYLLTATITAQQNSGQQQTLVATLPKLAEARGAAGVKAGQAAHSYPGTPPPIRDSLARLKSRSRMPFRWELIKLIQSRVPKELYDDIAHIGTLLGGASFYVAVEVVMKNGSTAVLRLLRENAHDEIKYGFAHLAATLELCQHEKVANIHEDLKFIVEEATKSAQMEVDETCVQEQYKIAERIYSGKEEQVIIDQQLYRINIQPVALYTSGPGFQLISKAEGREFNDLKTPDETKSVSSGLHNRSICQAVAFAVCKTELMNILGDDEFDPDRHGAQGCIKPVVAADGSIDVTVTYFDFGEISPKPATPAQLKHCHDFFKQATAFSFSNVFKFAFSTTNLLDDLRDKLIEYIRKHQDAGDDLSRLRRILKASLALQDYFEVLKDSKDLMEKLKDAAMQQLKQHAPSVVPVSMFGQFYSSITSSLQPSDMKHKQ